MSELETAARAVPRVARGVAAALALLGLACGEPAEDSSRVLRSRAEPHLREFETFDAWARPIRREPHIVAAWVERAGADPRRVGLRTEAPLTFDWVELRGVPMLARLEAADAELPDARSPQGPPVRVLVLSREADSARGGGDVRVTVAFEAPAE